VSIAAAVGLGANLGSEADILGRFRAIADALATLSETSLGRSAIYRSPPHGPVVEQPWFLNAAVALELPDGADPVALMAALLDMETLCGRRRDRSVAQGPREIDLDLLIFGAEAHVVDGPIAVTVPHPRLSERGFVLLPLVDLYGPDYVVPGLGRSLAALVDSLGSPRAERTEHWL